MDDVLAFVLKQIPLVVFMSIAIWQQQKEKKEAKKDLKDANKANAKEVKELNEAYSLRLKELNDYIRDSDLENMKVLEAIKAYMIKNDNNDKK